MPYFLLQAVRKLLQSRMFNVKKILLLMFAEEWNRIARCGSVDLLNLVGQRRCRAAEFTGKTDLFCYYDCPFHPFFNQLNAPG